MLVLKVSSDLALYYLFKGKHISWATLLRDPERQRGAGVSWAQSAAPQWSPAAREESVGLHLSAVAKGWLQLGRCRPCPKGPAASRLSLPFEGTAHVGPSPLSSGVTWLGLGQRAIATSPQAVNITLEGSGLCLGVAGSRSGLYADLAQVTPSRVVCLTVTVAGCHTSCVNLS